MSGSPSLSFTDSRRGSRRWVRVLTVVLLVVLVVVVLVAATGGLVWGYAWWRLGGTEVASLTTEERALGVGEPSAPEGVTTYLVALTDEIDETSPGSPDLRGPLALVQGGGAREGAAVVLLLPSELPVGIEGDGVSTLGAVHREGGMDALVRAVVDYSGVDLDHVVTATTTALPSIVEAVDGVEACTADGCAVVDGAETRRRVDALVDLEVGADGTAAVTDLVAVLRGAASQVSVPAVLRNPLVSRRVIDRVADEIQTDVSLRGGVLLGLAEALGAPGDLAVVGLPALRNPDTGDLLVLPERAATRFALLREGGVPPAPEEDDDAAAVLAATDVVVLNGTGTDGFASRLQVRLEAEGVRVVGTGNAPSFDEDAATVVRHGTDDPSTEAAAILLARALGGAEVVAEDGPLSFEGDPVDIIVVGGADLDEED